MRAVRTAGTAHAISAAVASSAATVTSDTGSRGSTRKSRVEAYVSNVKLDIDTWINGDTPPRFDAQYAARPASTRVLAALRGR
jgi:hypothetical protein